MKKVLLAGATVVLAVGMVACGIIPPGSTSSHADTSMATDPHKGWVEMWGGERTPAGDIMYKRCDGSTLIIKSSFSQIDSGIVSNSTDCR